MKIELDLRNEDFIELLFIIRNLTKPDQDGVCISTPSFRDDRISRIYDALKSQIAITKKESEGCPVCEKFGVTLCKESGDE